MADKKLSEFEAMGYDNSTPVMIPAVRYSSSEAGATKENRNIPLNLFYQPSFLKYEWSDCLRNEPCWLRADTFSWHSGDSQYANSYEQVYNHLLSDIDGKSLQSETISGITIEYYLADDMHKICPASQEENLISLYNTVGIAWYYIIDTTNTRFKLPRTKFGFTGLRDNVGNYVPDTAPRITGTIGAVMGNGASQSWLNVNSASGAFYRIQNSGKDAYTTANNNNGYGTVGFDASRSSSVYQDNAPVQQRATQMYLYCYVGKFSKSAVENIAGEHTELFNDKVDLDSSWGFPSSTYDDLTVLASGSTYTAPANGWYRPYWYPTTAGGWIRVARNGIDVYVSRSSGGTSNWWEVFEVQVKKGDIITIYYGSSVLAYLYFYYAQKTN